MPKTGGATFFSRPASATLLPVLATIACILCLPILVSHIRSRNLAASVLIFWIILENVFNLVNPLLWPTNDFANGWNGAGLCDVESKLRLAASIGYVGALVCIYRHLAVILNTEQIVLVPSPAQRRRRIAIEMALCFGFPVYIMIAGYIVQSGRYYILAIAGCVPMLDSSWPSVVLVLIWPGVMWVVAAGYCSMIIHRLIKYRRQVSGILSSPHSRYNQSQFVRLFAMATALIVIFLPVALYIFVLNLSFPGTRRAYSWSRIHTWTPVYFTRSYGGETFDCWVEVVTGYVVFISFGFSRDALLTYRRVLRNLGLGKIFARLRCSRGQGVRGTLQSLGDVSLATRFGSMSSRVKLIFSRRSNETSSPVPNMSSSRTHPVISPSTDLENGPQDGPSPAQLTQSTNSAQPPITNARSARPWFFFRPRMRPVVASDIPEDVRMGPLIREPPPARVPSTRSLALPVEDQNVIIVTRELEQHEIFFQVV